MAVAPTPVAAAPDAPDRAQRATFSARATAFFDWIKNTFVAGVNALASVTYSNAIEAATQATAAAASASAASGSVAAAQSYAAQAALYGGAAAHNPATNYAVGAVVKSNVNYAPYKCRAAGIDASDPSANADKWKPAALEIDNTGYPIIRPSLTLDFANSQIFDPRITFTRASTATRTNSKGQIELVASGVPRIDYDPVTGECKGLLVEEARTNLLTYSEQFDNAAWANGGITVASNTVTSPDGSVTADALLESTTASAFHYAQQTVAKSASSTTYTYSVYIKNKGRQVVISATSGPSGTSARVDPSTGTITSALGTYGTGWTAGGLSISSVSNGWYLVSAIFTTDALTAVTCQVALHNGTTTTYTGDGTSGIYLWGAQLEAGAFPTSYIPSGGAATTRAADVAVMTGVDFSGWYRQDEGTFVVSGKRSQPVPAAQYPRLLQVGTSAANTMAVLFGGSWLYASSVFGGAEVFNAGAARTETVDNQAAMAYKYNDYALSVSGGSAAADTTGGVPAVDRLAVGLGYGSGDFFNGTIRDITYYPLRLTNAELQTLSAQ